jgi:hypothetical protein
MKFLLILLFYNLARESISEGECSCRSGKGEEPLVYRDMHAFICLIKRSFGPCHSSGG